MQLSPITIESTGIISQNEPESDATKLQQSIQTLGNYLKELRERKDNKVSAAEHESVIARLTLAIGQASIEEMLTLYDCSDEEISIGQQTYRRKHKASKTYQSSLGPVTLERHVYSNRKKEGDGKCVCPLELQAGIIEGYWTENAASNCAWLLAHLTPQETEEALLKIGMMNPSRSSLDRLPKALLGKWDEQVVTHSNAMTSDEKIPDDAVSMAVSLDGVMVCMKSLKDGKTKGTEWREASCGSISFFDEEGERLSTTQYGRMPEHKKKTLKLLLQKHAENSLKKRPDLKLVHIADGAQDNWTFFDEDMPYGTQITDYFHACQYLKKAFDAAYAKDKFKAKSKYDEYKVILRDDGNGSNKVLRALRYQKNKFKSNDDIKSAVTYFTNNQHRMNYAKAKENNLPIGSGIVEATCKSLVSQRLKRSGMSWQINGGQSILTLRSLVKSHRFDAAWPSIINRYKSEVIGHGNVVKLFG